MVIVHLICPMIVPVIISSPSIRCVCVCVLKLKPTIIFATLAFSPHCYRSKEAWQTELWTHSSPSPSSIWCFHSDWLLCRSGIQLSLSKSLGTNMSAWVRCHFNPALMRSHANMWGPLSPQWEWISCQQHCSEPGPAVQHQERRDFYISHYPSDVQLSLQWTDSGAAGSYSRETQCVTACQQVALRQASGSDGHTHLSSWKHASHDSGSRKLEVPSTRLPLSSVLCPLLALLIFPSCLYSRSVCL